jgi:transcription elongation factor Elf1
VHGVEVPYSCATCDIELSSEAEYTKHMRQQHMATAVCELCGKECYSKVGVLIDTLPVQYKYNNTGYLYGFNSLGASF